MFWCGIMGMLICVGVFLRLIGVCFFFGVFGMNIGIGLLFLVSFCFMYWVVVFSFLSGFVFWVCCWGWFFCWGCCFFCGGIGCVMVGILGLLGGFWLWLLLFVFMLVLLVGSLFWVLLFLCIVSGWFCVLWIGRWWWLVFLGVFFGGFGLGCGFIIKM